MDPWDIAVFIFSPYKGPTLYSENGSHCDNPQTPILFENGL